MAHSFSHQLLHCVFSTKEGRPLITADLQTRLWPYIGGIAREHGMKTLSIGGVADYLHLLLSLPATLPLAKAMQLIKGNSSKWVHDTFPEYQSSGWQEGYGAFSIGVSDIVRTKTYIENQAEHYHQKDFKAELTVSRASLLLHSKTDKEISF